MELSFKVAMGSHQKTLRISGDEAEAALLREVSEMINAVAIKNGGPAVAVLSVINGGTLWGIWDSAEEEILGIQYDRCVKFGPFRDAKSLADKLNRQAPKFRR